MVSLKPRLKKIAALVKPGSIVADIGSNHGYLPLYLVIHGISPKVFVTEQFSRGLKQVQKLINFHGLTEELQLRVGDGFSALEDSDCVEAAVIAGMGGRTIADIIDKGSAKAATLDYLILQPMRDAHILRTRLKKSGFIIISEHLALENGHFFEIIRAAKGEAEENIETPFPSELGAVLINSRDPLLESYLRNKLYRCRRVLVVLSESDSERAKKRRAYFSGLENYLKELLLTVFTS